LIAAPARTSCFDVMAKADIGISIEDAMTQGKAGQRRTARGECK